VGVASTGVLEPFRQRWPWLGGDLQTLRDTLLPQRLPPDRGQDLVIDLADGDQLLAMLDQPLVAARPVQPIADAQQSAMPSSVTPRAWVVVVHGLGGSSERLGVRRLAITLQHNGFAVMRLNLRGAGRGRDLARGSYAAACNRDVLPVLGAARALAGHLPLMGVGLSLGGTVLLNAVLSSIQDQQAAGCSGTCPLLDGLVCISSPLDLQATAQQIERPRNRLYARWLLQRLVAETLGDPHGISATEHQALAPSAEVAPLCSIRAFDAAITAPRWGYGSLQDYYRQASPLQPLLRRVADPEQDGRSLVPMLLLQACDDPWVPAAAAQQLAAAIATPQRNPAATMQVLLTRHGGHNGFHGGSDRRASKPQITSSWSDRLTTRWLAERLDHPGQA
jgi:predicted alpha/beta-fold hydrolase